MRFKCYNSHMICLLVVLAIAVCGAADCPVLRTAAETRAYAERASETNDYRFVLRGTVMSWIAIDSFILKDESGAVWLRLSEGRRVSPGDRLEVRGHSVPNFVGNRTAEVDDFVLLGRTEPPPPIDVALCDINATDRSELTYRTIRTCGIVINAFHDEIDPRFHHLVLRRGSVTLHASIPAANLTTDDLDHLLGAEVRVTGTFMLHQGGRRLFSGNTVYIPSAAEIEILRGADDETCDAPPLEDVSHMDPAVIVATGLRRVEGIVTAVWHGDTFLIRTGDGRNVTVSLVRRRNPPTVGALVCVIGFPDTDLFHVNLIDARVVRFKTASIPGDDAVPTTIANLLSDGSRRRFDVSQHGRVIRLSGTVTDLPSAEGRINLRSGGGFTLPIDISACPDIAERLKEGCKVEATGICIVETDSWRPNAVVPQVKGLALVIRSPDDVKIISGPPLLTVGRLSAAVVILLAFLIGVIVWNRVLNGLVNRRSRELIKEQIARTVSQLKVGERTRLAVELHDALSQNLAAVACLVGAARRAVDSGTATAGKQLQTTERILNSCRTELKHCLFDLRSDMLERHDFSEAIRMTLDQLHAAAEIAIRFSVPRTRMTDSTAHAILCIIRELVSNAVRHGKASKIHVAGSIDGDTLKFSVRDNGTGFDPAATPGPCEGHFGLDGIRDRVQRIGGDFRIEATSGKGTYAVVILNAKGGIT